jgi:hypothetical protein
MGICDYPFDSSFSKFSNMEEAQIYIDNYNTQCVLPKLDNVTQDISKYMNQYTNENDRLANAQQTNIDTMKLYNNDYYYVMIKGIVYFIIMGCFVYFFGISNLIQGIKTTGGVLKDKAIIIKDKAIEMKEQVKLATQQKLDN